MEELYKYREKKPHKFKRYIWKCVNSTIFRCMPGYPLCYVRILLLKLFGADIPMRTLVSNFADIYAPWNLKMEKYSCIGPHVELYNKDLIIIGENVVVSQGSYLCTASHDISSSLLTLITKPIIIKNRAWIASDAFIGMGVIIGEGAIVGARGCVYKDVAPWTVVGGNPAKYIKNRILKNEEFHL